MTTTYGRGIGVVSTSVENEHTLSLIHHLDEEEFSEIVRAAGHVNRVNASTQISLIDKNYRRLMSMRKLYAEHFRQGQRVAALDSRDALENLANEVTNWLTATRLFVDHLETEFKRLHGPTSPQTVGLLAAYSQEFDLNLSYRFLYKLRNYTQHCGFPVSDIGFQGETPDPESPTVTRFVLKRDKLLEDFDWGAVVTPDLRAMPEDIEVLTHIKAAMPSFQRIYLHVFRERVRTARESCSIVEKAASRVSDQAGIPHLLDFGEMAEDGGFDHLQLQRLPVELAMAVRSDSRVSETEEKFANWAHGEAVPTATSMTPAQREQLAVAVALMGIYLEDHGPSLRVREAISRCITLANSAEPLIAGMTEMGAIALFMASSSVGATPETVLANMLEQ